MVMEGMQHNLAREHHRKQGQCARRAHLDITEGHTTLVRTQAMSWFIRPHIVRRGLVDATPFHEVLRRHYEPILLIITGHSYVISHNVVNSERKGSTELFFILMQYSRLRPIATTPSERFPPPFF